MRVSRDHGMTSTDSVNSGAAGAYVSPVFRDKDDAAADAWHVRAPKKWEHRHEEMKLQIQQLFDDIDTDQDGRVSSEELATKLRDDDEIKAYMVLSGRSTEGIFEQIDTDRDGQVSQEEFLQMLNAPGHTFTVEWLEEQIVWHYDQVQENHLNNDLLRNKFGQMVPSEESLGHPTPVFLLLFELRAEKRADGQVVHFLSNEAASLCQRLWSAQLSVDMRLSVCQKEIMILLGIPNSLMQDQARDMPDLRVRLAKTKGMVPYDQGFHEHYAVFDRHTLGDKGEMFVPESKTGGQVEFAGRPFKTRWTSALRQHAIRHRMEEFGIDIETRMHLPSLRVLLSRVMRKTRRRGKLRANRIKDLLTAAGGFRENCASIMGTDVALLGAQVLAHLHGTYFPTEEMWSTPPVFSGDRWQGGIEIPGKEAKLKRLQQKACDEHMRAHSLPLCTYETIVAALESIASYHSASGPGVGEQFVGTLRMFFPLHDQEELHYLTDNWARANLMFKFVLKARANEGQYSLAMADPNNEKKFVDFHGIPLGFLYQPIDEIRDYFVRVKLILSCVPSCMPIHA